MFLEQMKVDVWDIDLCPWIIVCAHLLLWLVVRERGVGDGDSWSRKKEGGTVEHFHIFLLLIRIKEGEVQFVL